MRIEEKDLITVKGPWNSPKLLLVKRGETAMGAVRKVGASNVLAKAEVHIKWSTSKLIHIYEMQKLVDYIKNYDTVNLRKQQAPLELLYDFQVDNLILDYDKDVVGIIKKINYSKKFLHILWVENKKLKRYKFKHVTKMLEDTWEIMIEKELQK